MTMLQTFFSAQAQQLADGRISELSRAFSLPLPVFLPASGSWHVLKTRTAVMETFWTKHRSVRAAGVGRLRACVTAEAAGSNGRLRAEVTWFYIGACGRRLGRTTASYYVSRHPEGLSVDLMEFRRVAFLELHDWFAENATELPRAVRRSS